MNTNLRLVRQLHLWIGAWGAIAAILFGLTGVIQNHRAVLRLPQGDTTEVDKIDWPVPVPARATPEALQAWLTGVQHLTIDGQRLQPGRPVRFDGQSFRQPAHWSFLGGNARHSVQAEYNEGADTVTVRKAVQSPLAVLLRLHKGVGGGVAWIMLTDSFAVALVALGVSGLMLWSRGRTLRQWACSTVGAVVIVLLVIGGAAAA